MTAPTIVILVAGRGSALPKVLHPLCGRPLVHWPVEAARDAGAGRIVVVDSIARPLDGDLPQDVVLAVQERPDGTADALESAAGDVTGVVEAKAGGDATADQRAIRPRRGPGDRPGAHPRPPDARARHDRRARVHDDRRRSDRARHADRAALHAHRRDAPLLHRRRRRRRAHEPRRGTITANHDGRANHRTTIGSGVRGGVDTMFVAPVSVGDGAWTAAGSVVTEDVPAGALALDRSRQTNIAGYANRTAPAPASAG